MKITSIPNAHSIKSSMEDKQRIHKAIKLERANGLGDVLIDFGKKPEYRESDFYRGSRNIESIIDGMKIGRAGKDAIARVLLDILERQILEDEKKLLQLGVELT